MKTSSRNRHFWVALAVGLTLLVFGFLAALAIGARSIPLDQVWAALTGGEVDSSVENIVIDMRLPRSTIALVAGLALGLAGALTQSLTRNPLADPGVLGLNAGASFMIAISVVLFGSAVPGLRLPFAFIGAFAVAVAIFFIGGTSSTRSAIARVTLAGVAIGAVLSGIVGALTLVDQEAFSVLRAWNAASLETRQWHELWPALPCVLLGVIIAFGLGPSFNAMALGEDTARSLGINAGRSRMWSLAAITLLAGSATAIAGPISFVGLMIPHLARSIVGSDMRLILALTAVFSPVLLLIADVVGRIALPTGEVPVGLVTSFLGAPVLIALAQRKRLVGIS